MLGEKVGEVRVLMQSGDDCKGVDGADVCGRGGGGERRWCWR